MTPSIKNIVVRDVSDEAAPELPEPDRRLLSLVSAGSRVALVGGSFELDQILRSAGCEVLSLGDSPRADDRAWDALRQFRPAKVVLADAGRSGAALKPVLHTIVRVAPGAEIVVAFWNASAASALLAALVGRSLGRHTAADQEVRAALIENGFSLAAREVWKDRSRCWTSEEADRALRQLFTQLNPAADDDWIVYTGRRPAAPIVDEPHRRIPGLLSVVIRNHTAERLQLIDQTIFSLACQKYRPLEIVIATQARESDAVRKLTAVLERHRHVADYDFQVLSRPSIEDIRGKLVNVGIEAAHGQYLAFLDDDDIIYPHHYSRLIEALRKGTAAWSVAQTRAAWFTFDASGDLYCKKKERFSDHERFSLADLVRDNYIPAHAYVLDRDRLGCFPIAFSENVNRCEDYTLLMRLVACFRPEFLAGGASCEYRLRDDGSNSTMLAGLPEETKLREEFAWQSGRHAKDKLKRSLQLLVNMEQFDQDLRAASNTAVAAGDAPVRHLLADNLNLAAKRRLPELVHTGMKKLALLLVSTTDTNAR